ncbi:MAG: hypothetical protein LBK29_04135 [Oscillospiraceae bacterium]|jgi:ComF family protein|nr:hypothetical protein [Oscillospiraceae bacterium]
MSLLNLLDTLGSLIFPKRCAYCDEIQSKSVCYKCEKILNRMFRPRIIETNYKDLICFSPINYNGLVKKAILKLKFNGDKSCVPPLSDLIVRTIKVCLFKEKIDFITCVPSYRDAKKDYNQSELIAKSAANKLGLSFKNVLIKIKENDLQHDLNFSDRQINVKGVYEVCSNISGENILICDDVITTGATLNECVCVLSKFSFSVKCVAASYTKLNKNLK